MGFGEEMGKMDGWGMGNGIGPGKGRVGYGPGYFNSFNFNYVNSASKYLSIVRKLANSNYYF